MSNSPVWYASINGDVRMRTLDALYYVSASCVPLSASRPLLGELGSATYFPTFHCISAGNILYSLIEAALAAKISSLSAPPSPRFNILISGPYENIILAAKGNG
jgi:hypothetical protein